LLLAAGTAQAAETLDSAKEYQIKAAYVAKLAGFVTWPDERFNSASAPLQVCILGEDSFRETIDLAARQAGVKGRSVEVRRMNADADTEACHIVFISQSEQRRMAFILQRLEKQMVLTVSDNPEFLRLGGMVEFYINQQRQIRLQVDPETVQSRGLKVSANLLAIGRKKD
jgi:hypothetical protein